MLRFRCKLLSSGCILVLAVYFLYSRASTDFWSADDMAQLLSKAMHRPSNALIEYPQVLTKYAGQRNLVTISIQMARCHVLGTKERRR